MTAPTTESVVPIAVAAGARAVQLTLRASLLRDAARLWPMLDKNRLADTFPSWLQAMTRLVTSYHSQSAIAAGRSYRAARVHAVGDPGPLDLVKLAPAPDEQWTSTAFGYSGPGMLQRDTARPGTALSTTLGTASRIALDGARTTVLNTTHADDKAVGYYRVTDGHPCAFCALLAARGIVYKSTTVGFKAHNDCGCTGAPAFSRDQELPEISRTAADVYDSRGKGPALVAFRKAWAEHQAAQAASA